MCCFSTAEKYMCMHKQAGVWHHIHWYAVVIQRSCLLLPQRQKKTRHEKESQSLSVCESNRIVKLDLFFFIC